MWGFWKMVSPIWNAAVTCSACSHDGDDDLDDGDGCGLLGGRDHDDLPVAATVLNIWRFAFPGKEQPSQTTWALRFFLRVYGYCRVHKPDAVVRKIWTRARSLIIDLLLSSF